MISTGEMPTLDDTRILHALRVLRRTGRRLIQRRKDWAVVGASDALAFATLTQADVALLAAENLIVPTDGGGHVVATAEHEPAVVPRTGPWVFEVVGRAPSRRSSQGFASLADRAQAGEGPLTLRQALAGLRLIADAEQSQRGERITMDWSGLIVDSRRRRGRDGGLLHAARRAQVRIARLRREMGEPSFALVWSACVDRASVRTLARARHIKGREVQRRLSLALEKLAAAYDGVAAEAEA